MGLFNKKNEMRQKLLTQLSRIADALDQEQKPVQDESGLAIARQLNRIVEYLEQPQENGTEENQKELITQLSKMAAALEAPVQDTTVDVRKAQLQQLERIADAMGSPKVSTKATMSLQEKKRAAYALNLCLVSVSQIIDYSDIYILEQEYEGILNNLNLENMPKDEALLDIMRQLLDTITFFRIQEVEKQFVEKAYQNQMKEAIWSAVSGCGVILACPDPTVMLVSLLTQVGSGYMNYRKEKAKIGQEHEKAMWELHKAAIEQFNGLRRELFTTAWKLADAYEFSDDWRLTESQIAQYNRILMDPNLSRRLERLSSIEDKFCAYPPFWYFKGHTALVLSEEGDGDPQALRAIARQSYEQYFEINALNSELLRTDPICATCALEYVALMREDEEALKLQYIQRAMKCAGTQFDLVQLCAMAYLDLRKTKEAASILKMLVCEGYNESINAQLLSALCISEYLKGETGWDCHGTYRLLGALTDEALVAWPESGTVDEQYAQFVVNRRSALMINYANFMCDYYTRKSAQFVSEVFADKGNTEAAFVKFAQNMEKELISFPNTQMDEQFPFFMLQQDETIRKIVKSGKNATNKTFEDIFGNVFRYAADNIGAIQLTTMEEISRMEQQQGRAFSEFYAGVAEELLEQDEPEYTLETLYAIEKNRSEMFYRIKEEVKKYNLLTDGAKRMDLLLAGSAEYYRYLKSHKLEGAPVVAVLNDRSWEDNDLLITETGLLTQKGKSKMARNLKFGILMTSGAGMVAAPVERMVSTNVMLMQKEIPFAQVEYRDQKLINPGYSNKKVNMAELNALVNSCQKLHNATVEADIRKRILG